VLLAVTPESESASRAISHRSELANAVVSIHAKHYGRGPTKARAHIHEDFALVVLEDVYTPGERTLIEAGKFEHVANMREAFQSVKRDEFIGAAESITGRIVRGFVSQSIEVPQVSVELFLFEPAIGADEDGGPPSRDGGPPSPS
jgi:uncharacterized protein YbcI